MKMTLDEEDLSFYLNVMDKIIYENVQEFNLDIYYNDKGYPANIHDLGAGENIPKYRISLINEICKRNNTNDIWRVSSDAFAIIAKNSNCGSFKMEYKGIILNILKKSILIKNV
jgi:hypothetical protein